LRIAFNENIVFLDRKLVTFRVHEDSTTGKNRSQGNLISISVTDRIRLATKLLEHQQFAAYRDISKELNFNPKLQYKLYLRKIIKRYGISQMVRLTGVKQLMKYLDFDPIALAKSIKRKL
jgi:hypothetical protein